MRQTIGGTWIFQLMILFIGIFTAYIILTLNYSKTVRIKNEMIGMIEKYEGLNDISIELVNNYLKTSGYSATGVCNEDFDRGIYGATSLDITDLEEAQAGKEYYYCVKKFMGTNTSKYYQVVVFYRFNLPVLGEISQFGVRGVTSNFVPVDDRPNSPYCYAFNDTRYGYCGSNNVGNTGGGYQPSVPSTPSVYTVSFNVNGGVGSYPSQSISQGGKATNPGTPTRSGYTFNGWVINGVPYNFNQVVNSDLTLVASWTKIEEPVQNEKIKVTLDLAGGSCYMGYCSTVYEINKGESLSKYLSISNLPNKNLSWAIRRPGYTFQDLKSGSLTINTTLYSDTTFVAQWTKNNGGTVWVTFDFSGGKYIRNNGKIETYSYRYVGLSMGDGTNASTMRVYDDFRSGTFVKEGYSFVCFATPDGKCFEFGKDVPAQDTYLHIIWQKN